MMKQYILQGKQRYAAEAVTIFVHYPEEGQEKLPDLYMNEELKWFVAEADQDDDIKELVAETDLTGEEQQELCGWYLTEWESNHGDWDIPFELSEAQQQEIEDNGYYDFFNDLGYEQQEMIVTPTGPTEVLEVVTNKTQGITHTYEYNNKKRYKPFTEQDMVIELLRGTYTPDAIHYRLVETLAPYGIKLNKRHAREYDITRKNKITKNEVDINIEFYDDVDCWFNIRTRDLVSKNEFILDEKSYISDRIGRARNHQELSECMRAVEQALELVKETV
jgi:hypothetical protein